MHLVADYPGLANMEPRSAPSKVMVPCIRKRRSQAPQQEHAYNQKIYTGL